MDNNEIKIGMLVKTDPCIFGGSRMGLVVRPATGTGYEDDYIIKFLSGDTSNYAAYELQSVTEAELLGKMAELQNALEILKGTK